MLIERSDPEDVFARVPELAAQTDPVLVQLDRLLADDDLYRPVRGDLARPPRPGGGRWGAGARALTRPAWCCGPRPCSRSTWQARLPFSAPAGARCGARGRRSSASCAARPPRPAVAQQRPLDERVLQIAEPTLQQAQTLRQALDPVGDPPRPPRAPRAPAP